MKNRENQVFRLSNLGSKFKMSRKNLKILYYIAWAVGIIAAAILVYGIIKSLL